MVDSQILADAHQRKSAALALCNQIAREAMAELSAFTTKDADQLLRADAFRLVKLATDLQYAREDLSTAKAEFDALKRRTA